MRGKRRVGGKWAQLRLGRGGGGESGQRSLHGGYGMQGAWPCCSSTRLRCHQAPEDRYRQSPVTTTKHLTPAPDPSKSIPTKRHRHTFSSPPPPWSPPTLQPPRPTRPSSPATHYGLLLCPTTALYAGVDPTPQETPSNSSYPRPHPLRRLQPRLRLQRAPSLALTLLLTTAAQPGPRL